MKRIFVFITLLVIVFACKKDEVMVKVNSTVTPPSLTNPTATFAVVITQDNMTDTVTFAWSKTDYGVSSQVTYQVELDSKCNAFDTPVILGTSTNTVLKMAMSDFNSKLLNNLKTAANVLADVQVRITSTLNHQEKAISAPIAIKVTPYDSKPSILWLGVNDPSVPKLYATGATTYEGYHNITAGASFQISTNPVCADVVFGADGAGKISNTSTTEITMPRGGYYKLNVDTDANTFDTLYIASWGLIGSATPKGWDASTAMVYNASNGRWEQTVYLVNGALKFRANDSWDLNYGPAVIADHIGTLIQTNDAIDIPNSGNYIVSLDFSQSTSLDYTYTVTPTSDVPEPAKLWLPGGYENYSPSTAPTIYSLGGSIFEGYVNIPSGTGFKFTSNPDYNHTNYGDSGTAGVLTTDGLAPDLSLPTAGYWKLRADISALTYSTYLVNSWGIVGTATVGQWDNSTPMTFDATSGTWSITTDLANGALKFRANNVWDVNYGPADSNAFDGSLIDTQGAISINDAGNYTVTIDFSRSAAPYNYVYHVKKN